MTSAHYTRRLIITATLAVTMLTSCASSTYAPITVCNGPTEEVRVLRSLPAEGTFVRCGTIRIEGGGLASDDTALGSAIDAARTHGANAIVIVDNPDAKFTWAAGYARIGTAIAIRVRPSQ